MKRIISLVFSLVIICGALGARAEYLSPEQYQERAQSECSGVSGTFLTNQTKDCDDALAKCKAEYLQFLHSACFSTTDYYGDQYLTCDAATLAAAKQLAKSHQILIGSACALVKNEWPSEKEPVTVQFQPSAIAVNQVGIPNPNVPHVDAEAQPTQPEPKLPDAPVDPEGESSAVDANHGFADPSNPDAGEAPSFAGQQFSGGGCSLHIAGADSFSSSLLVIAALIAVFSSYLFLRNRKK